MRPLFMVQFSAAVNLPGYDMPQYQWVQRPGKAQAFLHYDRDEVVIGDDVFPANGGLVAHYRFARAAVAAPK
jgi:hypothetical protein